VTPSSLEESTGTKAPQLVKLTSRPQDNVSYANCCNVATG